MSSMADELATRLSDWLHNKDWSIRRFSREIKVSHTHAARIVNGEVPPSPELAQKISSVTGMTAEEILYLAGRLPKPPEWTPELDEWTALFEQLSGQDRAEMLELGRVKVGRRERERSKERPSK